MSFAFSLHALTIWDHIPDRLLSVLILLFFAVLFLQSGIDKVVDRKGNLDWLTGHFSKSLFKGIVPLLLTVLTVMELLSGASSLVAAVMCALMEPEGQALPFLVACLCGFTLLSLFTGQRIAKDYAGAAGIVPYLIVAIIAMIIFSDFFPFTRV